MAREYFKSKVDRDAKKLFDFVVWVFIFLCIFFAVWTTLSVMRNNYNTAVANCVNNTGRDLEYCKLLAK